jgi:hypothetical protein
MNTLLRLYPRAWRERYGEEMSAVLEDRPPGPFDWLDLMLGAFDAHLHGRHLGRGLIQGKGIPMSLRVGASAAVLGGVLWLIALAYGALAAGKNPDITFALVAVASVTLLVAIAGLSAFESRKHPGLIWSSVALTGVGVLLLVGGMLAQFIVGDRPVVGDLTPWVFWMLGVLIAMIGCAIFGLVKLATGGLPRWSTAVLCVGIVVQFLGLAGSNPSQALVLGGGALLFSLGWILIGWEALRADSARLIDQPA